MTLKKILEGMNTNNFLFEGNDKKVNAYPIVTVTYDDTFSFDYDLDEEELMQVVEVSLPCSGVDSNDINFSEEWMQKYLKDKTNFTVDSKIKNLAIESFKKEKTLIDPEKAKLDKLGFRITSIGYEPFGGEK